MAWLRLLPGVWRGYLVVMNWSLTLPKIVAPEPPHWTLVPGEPLRLRRSRGRKVVCQRGCVWITAPGQPDDIFLHAGDSWQVPCGGLVLIESDSNAVVTLG